MIFEKRKEFNKLRCKWRSLTEEYESLSKVEEEAWGLFYKACMGHVEKHNLENPFEQKSDDKEFKNKDIFNEDETKHVFRQAALKSHPDKSPESCVGLFYEISLAKKDGRLNKLFDGARKLDIKPDDVTINQIDVLKSEVDDLEKKIDEIIFSAHWIWHHANNKQKPKIIKTILEPNDE